MSWIRCEGRALRLRRFPAQMDPSRPSSRPRPTSTQLLHSALIHFAPARSRRVTRSRERVRAQRTAPASYFPVSTNGPTRVLARRSVTPTRFEHTACLLFGTGTQGMTHLAQTFPLPYMWRLVPGCNVFSHCIGQPGSLMSRGPRGVSLISPGSCPAALGGG